MMKAFFSAFDPFLPQMAEYFIVLRENKNY